MLACTLPEWRQKAYQRMHDTGCLLLDSEIVGVLARTRTHARAWGGVIIFMLFYFILFYFEREMIELN